MTLNNKMINPMEEASVSLSNLDQLNEGDGGVVYDVPDIRLLASLGIRIGKHIKVLTKSVARGPLIVTVSHRSIVIDRHIAKHITIKR